MRVKKMKKVITLSAVLLFSAAPHAHALPLLQLDADPGYYDNDMNEESTITTSDQFTLYALLTPQKKKETFNDYTDYNFFISAALTPPAKEDPNITPNYGSFTFTIDETTTTVNVTSDMKWGTPPVVIFADNKDLQSHGIFDTFYKEFAFTFDLKMTAKAYDVQTEEGFPTPSTTGDDLLYYASFSIDISKLDPNYGIHFDLYGYTLDGDGNPDAKSMVFAPFSHDVSTQPVPEPATMLLFGTGMAGLAGLVRKKYRA
jgi:hypothetical protein